MAVLGVKEVVAEAASFPSSSICLQALYLKMSFSGGTNFLYEQEPILTNWNCGSSKSFPENDKDELDCGKKEFVTSSVPVDKLIGSLNWKQLLEDIDESMIIY